MGSHTGESLVREFDIAKGKRSNWEKHWEEVAELVIPAYSGTFIHKRLETNAGQKLNQKQFDATAPIGLDRFAAVMESMLTPRNQKWHRLTFPDPATNKRRDVREYLEAVGNLLFRYRYAPKANFAGQNHLVYTVLGALGTGNLFIDELASEPGLRYKAVHLGELFYFENHQGIIDKAYRRFELSARQAVQKWGKERLSTKIVEASEGKDKEKKFTFLHAVLPRDEVNPNRVDALNFQYASYYIDYEAKETISEGGYNTFPYAIGRNSQAPGEIYGRSPAMQVLPSIQTINEEKKTMLRTGHKNVDPTLLLHDDGVLDAFSLRAGALNYGGVSKEGRALVHALPVGNIAAGEKMMELEKAQINDAFLVTLFEILTESPRMTATEVLERVREKGVLLSPTMGRQQSEYLGPLIEREIDVLSRQQLLPPMPQALVEAGGIFDVEYDSPLSRAQRAEEASGLLRTVETAIEIATQAQDPEPLDHFDWDVIIPEVSAIQAVPIAWLRSADAIKQRRENRAQLQQAEQAIQAAPAASALAKTAADAA